MLSTLRHASTLRLACLLLGCGLFAGHALAAEPAAKAAAAPAAAAPVAEAAIALPDGVSAGPSVEGIHQYMLANGMKVLLFPDPSKATTTVNVTYKVGSLHENYGETGMAHLLEHLMFKGTPDHPDIPAQMKKRGMSKNASTWLDRTNYFETFPADPAQLEWALRLEADRMVNSNILAEDLESEMTVVRNEMERGESNPVQALLQRTLSTAYIWHNYGNSTIGARADVENVSIPKLREFYQTYYQPDNAVLMVAGRFDPEQTLQVIADSFGKIPEATRTLPTLYTTEPTQDGARKVTVRRVGDVKVAVLAYHIPSAVHEDTAALAVLGNMLGDTPSGRLHKALVETGKAAGAGAFRFELHDPGMMLFYAQLPLDGDVENVADLLIEQAGKLGGKPVTEAEVERAKTEMLTNIELAFNDANRVGMAMSESIAAGDWRLYFLRRDRIEAVTAADVNRVAAAYLKPSNRTLGLFIPVDKPDRAIIPETPDVAALLEGYKGREPVAAGEVFDPSLENIEARTTRSVLPSGAKLALLPKDTRGDTVRGNISLHFGHADTLMEKGSAPGFVGPMLRRGTSELDREALATRLDQLKADVGISSHATGANVSISTTRENLPEVMQLVADMLLQPAFAQSEFDQLKLQSITGLQSQVTEPGPIAGKAMALHFDHYPAGHPRDVLSFDDSIAALKATTLDQVKAFYGDFYGANHAEFAFVGDFDPATLKTQLTALFSDWKAPDGYERIPNPYQPSTTVDVRLPTPDKANSVVLLKNEFALTEDDPDYPALEIGTYIFGGGALKSRIGDRLRQEEGLSYGAGAGVSAGILDPNASFSGYAITAPQNAAKVETGFREELALLLEKGITQEELDNAVAGILKARKNSRSQDASVVGMLDSQLYYGHTMQREIDYENALQALTVEQVNAALREHIDPESISFFAAGDFDKSKTQAEKPAKKDGE